MGIEDIQISEELETNAPSIKYRGDEGPKSPQEMEQMMMAQLEEEYAKYVFEMQEQGIEPMSMQQFIEQAMAEGQMSGGQPLPSDPTKPVNPFQPKPTGPVLPDRQMAAYGGIMGLDGRKQYGIGSSLKKFVRKVIPNEVSKIAVKAAPFVAPFNPLAAGLMAGVGGFDQTGRIGSSLKSGLMNYGLGNVARMAGGAGFQKGFTNPNAASNASFMDKYLSSPYVKGEDIFSKTKERFFPGKETITTEVDKVIPTAQGDYDIYGEKIKEAGSGGVKGLTDKITSFALDNKLLTGLVAGTVGASALMGNMEPEEIQDLQRGEGLNIESIRTEVIEAFKDPSGEKLAALRSKYPFLGTRESKNLTGLAYGGRIGFDNGGGIMMASSDMGDPKENAEYYSQRMFGKPYKELNADELEEFQEEMRRLMNKFMSNGGRINRAEGGIMDLGGMEKDYRAEGGFVPIGKQEKADDVPARLSVNEFVFTADAVRNAGGGDIDKGAEVMENMMKYLEQGGQVSEESQGMAGAQQMFETSERLSEVI